MITKSLQKLLLVCIMALPVSAFSQTNTPLPNTQPINRYQLLDKTWCFVGMKCPDKIGSEGEYIHFLSTLKLTATNNNNINYGTYVKMYKDMRDNPKESGTYSLTTDEVGNLMLTLKKNKTGVTSKYMIPMVETNHLTLIRTDDVEKCNITYAISLQ